MTADDANDDAARGQPRHQTAADQRREEELEQIREALRDLRFGVVEVVVQDGQVVQINRTEKRRLSHRHGAQDRVPGGA
jgi:hypothetical protein